MYGGAIFWITGCFSPRCLTERTIQTHLIYTFRPGLWTAASAGYGYGRESTVSGVKKNDRRENLAWALSFGCPITQQLDGRLFYYRMEIYRKSQ